MKFFVSLFVGIASFLSPHHPAPQTQTSPTINQATTTAISSSTEAVSVPSKKTSIIEHVVQTAPAVLPTAPTNKTNASASVSPAGVLSCNGSYFKEASACPSGQELVCPATGAPTCEWTAASQAALATQQAIKSKKESDAIEAQEAADARQTQALHAQTLYPFNSAMSKLTSNCKYPASSAQLGQCNVSAQQLIIPVQQQLIVGLSPNDESSELDSVKNEYTYIENQYGDSAAGDTLIALQKVELLLSQ